MKLERNLELFAREFPVEAMHLQYGSYPLPSWNLYEGEAEEWFSHLSLEYAKVIYIYGVGTGEYYFPLKKWLAKDPAHLAIFLEDDPGVLQQFFSTKAATQMLQDPQVVIYPLENIDNLYWWSVLTPFVITALMSYQTHKDFETLKNKVAHDRALKNALVEEYLKFGATFFQNFYPNILQLSESYWGNALFGKFQGIPAIICGAGPSLDKHLPKFAALKEKALIFAGGSALNALSSQGLLPHFGAGIDPNATQAIRLEASQTKVPFFYRSRMHREAVRKISGQKLYISGVGGYDIAEFYEKKLGLEAEYLDEGHNVVNFCTEIAVRMGCNPIIYIGLDLGFTDKKCYAKGVDEAAVIDFSPTSEENRLLEKKDIYGNPFLTLWKWISEAEWLSQFAKNHPECTLINATEGGLGIPEVPNQTLEEIHLKKQPNFDIQKAIDEAKIPQATPEVMKSLTLELKESLIRCKEIIQQLLAEIDLEAQNKATTGQLNVGKGALLEADLYAEPAYTYVLDIFHQVYARVQHRAVQQIKLNKSKVDPHSLALQKLKLQKEKLQFLHQVAEANCILMSQSL